MTGGHVIVIHVSQAKREVAIISVITQGADSVLLPLLLLPDHLLCCAVFSSFVKPGMGITGKANTVC